MKRFKDLCPGDPIWRVSKPKLGVTYLSKLKADGITQVYNSYVLSMDLGQECVRFGEEIASSSLAHACGNQILFCDKGELLQWVEREEDRIIDWIVNFNHWEDLDTAEEMFNNLYEEV